MTTDLTVEVAHRRPRRYKGETAVGPATFCGAREVFRSDEANALGLKIGETLAIIAENDVDIYVLYAEGMIADYLDEIPLKGKRALITAEVLFGSSQGSFFSGFKLIQPPVFLDDYTDTPHFDYYEDGMK